MAEFHQLPYEIYCIFIFFFFIQVMIQTEISVFLNVLLLWQCFSEQLRCWWKRGGGNAFTSPSPSKKTKQSPHKRRRRINKIKGTIERERERNSQDRGLLQTLCCLVSSSVLSLDFRGISTSESFPLLETTTNHETMIMTEEDKNTPLLSPKGWGYFSSVCVYTYIYRLETPLGCTCFNFVPQRTIWQSNNWENMEINK